MPDPINLPVYTIGSEVGQGWTSVAVGDLVRTYYQVYTVFSSPPAWQLSSFYTRDGYLNAGRASYRRPSSVLTWISIAYPLIRKWMRRWNKPFTLSSCQPK